MNYNTQKKHLRLPEYGRLVQSMADHALTLTDRTQRQHYAERIVWVMGHLNPKLRNIPDYQHKLWDHLAYITDYQLDIDYPIEIQRRDANTRPTRLPYPKAHIRYRHYGQLLEHAIKKLRDIPEGEERTRYIQLMTTRMKRNLMTWKGDGATSDKVAHDLETYLTNP